jgi:hypothetical protein
VSKSKASDLYHTFEAACRALDKLAAQCETLRRQVAILAKRIDDIPAFEDKGACFECPAEDDDCAADCAERMAAWSLAEAERKGQNEA